MRLIGGTRRLLRAPAWSLRPIRCLETAAAHSEPPSKVLHVRSGGKEITEDDLLELTRPFGSISKFVQLKTAKNQALLEMQDLSEAANVVQHYTTEIPRVRGADVCIQYSSHQELRAGSLQEQKANKVILVTIRNPLYQITVDTLHKVFSPHGTVEKMVIFQRSGLQALVQYSSDSSASQAKSLLNGRQIYDGCCDLDIQFSKSEGLEVKFNNELSRDYTNDSLPTDPSRASTSPSILGDGTMFSMPKLGGANGTLPASRILPPGVTGLRQQNVLLVSNLNDEKVDEDKLFNLFSGYGRILRIKLFSNKPDQALIQMSDGLQAELAMSFLKGAVLFGKPLMISLSKNSFIRHPETRDYSNSSRNRFTADYIRNCCVPAKIIHVSNLQSDIEQGELINHLAPHGIIENMKVFETFGSTKKQALCEFTSIEQATEAIVCKHLSRLKESTLRISFSRFHQVK